MKNSVIHPLGVFLFSLFLAGVSIRAEETIRQDIKSDLRYVVDRVDELLGGKRTDDNKNESTLRLTASEQIADRQTPQFAFDVGFILKPASIARWQKDAQNWFQRHWQAWESKSQRPSEVRSKPTPKPAGDPWRFSVDKHLTVAQKLSLQIYPRLRKDIETKYLVYAFLFQAGWSIKDQWDSQVTWITSLKTHPRFLLNWTNAIRWRITNQILSTAHGPGFSYLLSEHQVVSGLLAVNTDISQHSWGVESYTGTMTYRFAAVKEWMFISTNPFVNCLRTEQFHRDFGFIVSMETVF